MFVFWQRGTQAWWVAQVRYDMACWKFWDFFRTQNDFGVFTKKDGIEAVMVGLGINKQSGEAHGGEMSFQPLEYRSRVPEFPGPTGYRTRQPPGQVSCSHQALCALHSQHSGFSVSAIQYPGPNPGPQNRTLPPGSWGLGGKEPGGSALSISKGRKPSFAKIHSLGQHPRLHSELHGIGPDTAFLCFHQSSTLLPLPIGAATEVPDLKLFKGWPFRNGFADMLESWESSEQGS